MSLIFSIFTDRRRAWKLRYTPAPSQRFDQQHARMTAHLAGIGSPADALSFERFVIALVRLYQGPKRAPPSLAHL
jgi:hypothetical protein